MQVIQCEPVQKPTIVCLLVGSEAKNPPPISKYKDIPEILYCLDISLNASFSLIETIREISKDTIQLVCNSPAENKIEILKILADINSEFKKYYD